MAYKINIENPIPLILLIPENKTITGVLKKVYPSYEKVAYKDSPYIFFGSFKTYGGTEKIINGVLVIEDTATIETWYRPDIKANCQIALDKDTVYDILGEPENINKRNQILKFKVKRHVGGA